MQRIFFGLLLIFFNLNITVNDWAVIDLLPDFLGYGLIVSGLGSGPGSLSALSVSFARAKTLSGVMFAYTLLLFIFNLTGGVYLGSLGTVLGLCAMVLSFAVTGLLASGVRDLERSSGRDLLSERLLTAWAVSAVLVVVMQALLLFDILGIVTVIAIVAAQAYFIYSFHRSKEAYNNNPGQH